MHSYGTDGGLDTVHDSVSLLLGWFNLFKQGRLKHADKSVLVSNQEVSTSEDVFFVHFFVFVDLETFLRAHFWLSVTKTNALDV